MGMIYKQLVQPKPQVKGDSGYSLEFAQRSFDAPVKFFTAWTAWENTHIKHSPLEKLPNAYVPVWFYTTFQNDFAPLGHVLIWSPRKQGLWGPPRYGHGRQLYRLEDVINPLTNYVGWSEDLYGHKVVEPFMTEERWYDDALHSLG